MIKINFDKAKNFCHERRRIAREKEFAPYDNVIAKQIPGQSAEEAELARQIIREKYANIQIEIDAAQSLEELKTILNKYH